MSEDFDLIVSSFAQQYGIRLLDAHLSWCEFTMLLAGLNSKSPLGQIVAIRSEKDSKVLKHFTKEQKQIRSDWLSQHCKVSEADFETAMRGFENMFRSMAGGGR